MTKTGYLKRYRFPEWVMKISIIIYLFLPSRLASMIVYLVFRVKVSHKTICEWCRKFLSFTPQRLRKLSKKKVLICNADEKYVKVKGEWNYWWSIKDCLGNMISTVITSSRDYASAKKLFIDAKLSLGRDVNILTRDALAAYDKATKYLGRNCKSIITGIHGKSVIYNHKYYWLTNNPAESLNSEIDFYMRRFQNNFPNLECANRFAQTFKLLKHLKRCFAEKKLLEATSMLDQAISI
jgi:transposase-like protein